VWWALRLGGNKKNLGKEKKKKKKKKISQGFKLMSPKKKRR